MPSQPDAGPRSGERDRRLDAVVTGRVQGVGFRYFVVDRARALALSGCVVNMVDGSVRCVAEGPEDALLRLLSALRDGPPGARVASIGEAWSAPTGEFDGFRVEAGHHAGD